jgi:hypothetical protein
MGTYFKEDLKMACDTVLVATLSKMDIPLKKNLLMIK